MQVLSTNATLPVYSIEPDGLTGTKQFKVYHFEGTTMPNMSEMLVPHRKDHYLLVFCRRGKARQWIDTTPYTLKENTIYFTSPNEVIVKEDIRELWSTGIAFTPGFLSYEQTKLPLIQNPHHGHELQLSPTDVLFVEDLIYKIRMEAAQPGDWQQRMLTAYLNVLLTYLSRLYTQQYFRSEPSADKVLLQKFQEKIDSFFLQHHEVNDYASMLYISAGHLSEVVKIQSGKPAIKHIHERLTLEARRFLVHTDKSLKDIAFDLGFSDASYFNRFFKRETGVTPAGYRAQIRKMYH
jgi:AraC family transcriptional regulator, transcriptional activator of pobA